MKKYIILAFILFLANQASCEELTPLQKRVREVFAQLKNKNNIEVSKEVIDNNEITLVEENNTYEQIETSNEDVPTEIILASDQEDTENTYVETKAEDEKEDNGDKDTIIVASAPKAECDTKPIDEDKKYDGIITAADAASKDRTAKINNKWSIEALGWNTELTGHVKIVENKNLPNSGEIIDFDRDTRNLDKKKVPGLKLSYKIGGRSSVDFNWTKIEQNGVLTIARQFKGKNYAANADFEINNSMFDLVYKYRFTHKVEESGREKSYVAGLFGIKASDMEFKLDGDVAGVRQNTSYSENIPVPYIGVEAGTYIGENIYLKAYYRYLKLNNIKDYDAKHADYDVALSYKLSNKDGNQDIFVDVGYRQVSYDVDGKGNDVELKYKGPYIGLEFRF